jgi:predicted thioredoxin/glutaredoxin
VFRDDLCGWPSPDLLADNWTPTPSHRILVIALTVHVKYWGGTREDESAPKTEEGVRTYWYLARAGVGTVGYTINTLSASPATTPIEAGFSGQNCLDDA